MCAIAKINGQEIDTIGALQKFCPKLVIDKLYMTCKNISPEDCLCPINVPMTAFENGYKCEINDDFDFVLEKITV